MEDSHVAAYSALLIGLLSENNKVRMYTHTPQLFLTFSEDELNCFGGHHGIIITFPSRRNHEKYLRTIEICF